MATFQYEAMNAAGQEVKAEIDAGTADEAISKIRGQGSWWFDEEELPFVREVRAMFEEWLASTPTPTAAGRPPPTSSIQ